MAKFHNTVMAEYKSERKCFHFAERNAHGFKNNAFPYWGYCKYAKAQLKSFRD